MLLTGASFQVFKVDLADSAKCDMPLAGGAVATSERFHRLAWSPSGVETSELPVRGRPTSRRSRERRLTAAALSSA